MPTFAHVFGGHAPVLPVIGGVPTDADFGETPPNGTVVINAADAARPLLYGRIAGAWVNLTTPIA